MEKHPELEVIVDGHTDNVGEDVYNLELSEKRAGNRRVVLRVPPES
jgi:outer membrane protein OmpA-like peptidoglycan-associated protein